MIKSKLRRSIMRNLHRKTTRWLVQKGIVTRISSNFRMRMKMKVLHKFRIRMKIKALKKNLHEREHEND